VGLFSFLDSIIGGNLIVRRIWQFHLIYVPIALILDLTDLALFIQSQQVYFILFIVTILLSVAVGVRAALRGNWEARIFIAGFSILALFGVHDILVGYDIIPAWHWMSQWGTFIFIIFLAFILEHKFSETQKQLKEYSEELEEKVRIRTSELYQKNRQLESTLKELKDTQNQLIIKEKMASLGNLIAGVAHEMNNPIGAMNSAGHVLQKSLEKIQKKLKQASSVQDLKDDQQLNNTLNLMKDNNSIVVMGSKRVSEIVKSLRTFARLDEAEFQDADIHQGINDTLTLLYHEIKNKVDIEKEYGNLPKIKCYPNQLNQVFMNILINSVQAIEEKGMIKIKTFSENNRINIKISDNGRGIPEKNLQKIFDPGFTTKGVGVGTGLGLSISYNIIQKHKGTINVASELGKGTTFEIILPNNLEKVNESSDL
jgi:signal transduction histidine kinase